MLDAYADTAPVRARVIRISAGRAESLESAMRKPNEKYR